MAWRGVALPAARWPAARWPVGLCPRGGPLPWRWAGPGGRPVPLRAQLRFAAALQPREEAPAPADAHKPPSKERPPTAYPHLVFTAEPCVFDVFRKHSVVATAAPLVAALATANLLPANIAWLGCLLLWPMVRCSFNVSRTCPRLVLWTDPDHQVVKKSQPPPPAADPQPTAHPETAADTQGNEASERAVQPREDAPPPAPRADVSEFDPWAALEEKELVLFTHAQVEVMNNVLSTTGRGIKMIKLEDVEWLGYEEAVTDAGRELHCWRLLKVKDVHEPYNIFFSDRFDVALPSLVNANPQFKVCEVSPINSWDTIPLFGFKIDKMFEPGDLPSPTPAPAPPGEEPAASSPPSQQGTAS
eukprot:EG_transcript_15784